MTYAVSYVMSLVTDAFAVLRNNQDGDPGVWGPVYRRGLIAAFEQGLLDEAAELAVFGAMALEAQGRYSDAIAELEFAIPRASESTNVTVMLLGTLGMIHAFRSNDAALHAIDAAAGRLDQVSDPYTRHLFEASAATADLIFFRPRAIERATSGAKHARTTGFPWVGQGLDIWTIPAIAASGSVRNARPWTNMLAAEVEGLKSNYRRADAAALDYCLRTAYEAAEFDPAPFDAMRRNRMAAWRARTAALRSAVLRGDRESAARHLEAMEEL